MTDYRALAAEELLPEYAAMSDAQRVAAIRAKQVTVFLEVPTAAVHRRLVIDVPASASASALSAWGLIAINARRAATTAFASAASTPSAQDQMISHMAALVSWVDTFDTIDATDSEVRARFAAIFGALVTGGWITSATRDAIVAMASAQVSRAVQMGFVDLNLNDLAAARKVVAGG